MGLTAWAAAALAFSASCATPPKPAEPLGVQTTLIGPNTRLTLIAAPGLKVSALLKPALELNDGRVLRFDSPRLTPDSAYFAEPPSALAPGRHGELRGTLRASVCDEGAAVCRTVVLGL